MALTFKDIQDEIKRRSTRDQSGTQFDVATKNAANASLLRIAREAKWRVLRRNGSVIETIKKYTTGSGGGTFTNNSKSITMVGAAFLTDNIQPGRRISLQGSSSANTIDTITGETTLTLIKAYGGTTVSGTGTYSILGQESYNLPIQASHRLFLWHEEFGSPLQLSYIPEQSYYSHGILNTTESIPTHYRMWGEDMAKEQPKSASVMTVSSSDSGDTSISITVFGTVAGFPDSEIIITNSSNGTTTVAGNKSFTKVERISKSASSVGRITVTSDSANTTVAVIPIGDTTAGILYRKIQLHPLPNTVFPINVFFYKDPYRMVGDNDVHEMGQEFDEAIILLSVAKINYESNKDEGDKFFGLYKDEVKSLKKSNVDKIDWFPTLSGRRSRGFPRVHPNLRFNQAGAFFGPSSRS